MKNIAMFLFLFISIQTTVIAQTDLSEKIPGNWIISQAKMTEKLANGETVERKLEPVERPTIYFKSNNTGNFNFADKDSESFTWTISRNKIVIAYTGNNEICKSLNGDFRAVYRERKGEEKLDLSKNGFSVFLSRKL